jgi:hypothetical protein
MLSAMTSTKTEDDPFPLKERVKLAKAYMWGGTAVVLLGGSFGVFGYCAFDSWGPVMAGLQTITIGMIMGVAGLFWRILQSGP